MKTSTVLNRRAFLTRAIPTPHLSNQPVQAGLEPFTPSPDQPWDLQRAAHLARRTGFGAPLDQVESLLIMSP
ncbi:unnamed protein product, partial [Laminaria digitata]